MKKLVAALALSLSAVSFASTPATTALSNLVSEGTFSGKNCKVTVSINENSAGITVTDKYATSSFALVNSSKNVSVDEVTGSIAAKASLNSPFYLNGGSLILSVESTENTVDFSISTIAIDHRGNDASTYVTCSVLK